jgi:NAD-dependent DNA ligase
MKPQAYTRQIAAYINEQKRCLGALLGITQGLLCDRVLSDQEIHFLDDWLKQNDEICVEWPGDILHQRVKEVLADGIITEGERAYLVEELKKLIGGNDETLAAARHVTELAFDDVAAVKFPGMSFCLTGDFVYGPRDLCTTEIQKLGGMVLGNVTKRLHYLVIGTLGRSRVEARKLRNEGRKGDEI